MKHPSQLSGIGYYNQTKVTTADKREIVLYLYDGVIANLKVAVNAVEQQDNPTRSIKLGKAMDIIMELATMLDFEKGGPIAENLHQLYSFSLQQLLLANAGKDGAADKIRHSITIISTIRDAWSEIMSATTENTNPEEIEKGLQNGVVG